MISQYSSNMQLEYLNITFVLVKKVWKHSSEAV